MSLPSPIKQLRAEILNRLEVLNAETTQLKGTLLGLQLMCTHTDRIYMGTDPRGSSKGEDRYKCGVCAKEWRE